MSSLITQVRRFTLAKHPNADALSLGYPEGTDWQCCCRTADFEGEDLALYIPIDTMVPAALAAEWGLPNAKDGKDFRIKTIRLRGELSQGLMIPNKGKFAEGDDVAEALGLSKYEPPEPGTRHANNCIPQPPGFDKYTDIENVKNFPNVLQEGECVVVTEKLHGSNARFAWLATGEQYTTPSFGLGDRLFAEVQKPGYAWHGNTNYIYRFTVGSRKMVYAPGETDQWSAVAEKYDLAAKLLPYPGYVLYGELVGPSVQKLAYGFKEKEFRAFDVFDGTRYLDPDDFLAFCATLGIPTVPVLYAGPYIKDVVLELRKGNSTLAGHVREGIVIKPACERWERGIGRVVVKSVNERYLLGDFDE